MSDGEHGDQTSVDIVYEEIKARMATQDGQIDSLDGKANFGLSSATLLTTIVGLNSALSPTEPAARAGVRTAPFDLLFVSVEPQALVNALSLGSFIVYIAVIIAAFQAYRIRGFKTVPEPKVLMEDYLDKPADYTKRFLSGTRRHFFEKNAGLIDQKIRYVNGVIIGLTVEAVLLAALTWVQVNL